MNISSIQPSEIFLRDFIDQIKSTIYQYKDGHLNIDDKAILKSQMSGFVKKLRYLQRQRYREYIMVDGTIKDLPVSEEALLKEITDLIVEMDRLIDA
jgi:hypothetical protein